MNMKRSLLYISCTLLLPVFLSGCTAPTTPSESENTINRIDDIYGNKIGILKGSQAEIYTPELAAAGGPEHCDIIRYEDEKLMVKGLLSEETAAVIMDSSRAEYWTNQDDDLKILDELFYYGGYSICSNSDNTELSEQIDTVLALMEEDGVLGEISAFWNNYNVYQEISSRTNADGSPWEGFDLTAETPDTYENTLHVITCGDFPPFVSEAVYDGLSGIDMDILYELGKYLQMNIEITFGDYDAMFSCVEDETADIAIGAIPSEFAPEGCELSTPYYVTSLGVLTAK